MMTSNRPYFIRAIYDWLVDNHLTPYLLVDANFPDVEVPQEFVNEGRIVLDISPDACRGLHMENTTIVFTARFSGQPKQIFIVPQAVLAIYAKENGRGMEFGENYDGPTLPPSDGPSTPKGGKSRPALKLVKND